MLQPVADIHDRTVRWRQLVDLLSRLGTEDDAGLVEAALAMVRQEAPSIPDAARAATARNIAGRAADPRLIAIFAADKLAIAAPLLTASTLDERGWAIVHATASDEVAALLHSLGKEAPMLAEPLAVELEPAPVQPQADVLEPGDLPSIGEMVARIERLRTRRVPDQVEEAEEVAPADELVAAMTDTTAEPEIQDSEPQVALADAAVAEKLEAELVDGPSAFRWECDATGQIGWVEGAPRGALVGRSLTRDQETGKDLLRAFTDRAPFDGAALHLEETAVAGDWRLSGIPAFSPLDGRFLGYRGIARRNEPVAVTSRRSRKARINRDSEALRETIHEIKTPLNAIIGFAEIIDGQYLGPAHRNYRRRAAEIVGQARTLLGAIEDLDFAARLQSEIDSVPSSTAWADLLPGLDRDLHQRAGSREVQLNLGSNLAAPNLAIGADLAGRLIRRFLCSVIDAADAGERLSVEIDGARGARCRIAISRPMATVGLGEEMVLDPSYVAKEGEGPAILGIGFALRMVRGLARIVGGDLMVEEGRFSLLLPSSKA